MLYRAICINTNTLIYGQDVIHVNGEVRLVTFLQESADDPEILGTVIAKRIKPDTLAIFAGRDEYGKAIWLKVYEPVTEGDLADWYIHSVDDCEPVWTENHIEELCNDFIVIPKERVKNG